MVAQASLIQVSKEFFCFHWLPRAGSDSLPALTPIGLYLMINITQAKRYCRDELFQIENYEEAVASSKKWHCHHRLELTLDGKEAHSLKELKRLGMYYKRPAFELIFLRIDDHTKLHHDARDHIWFGRSENRHSEEARRKISLANARRTLSAETRAKLSEARKGREMPPISEETRLKRARSAKAWWDAHPEARKQRGEAVKQRRASDPKLLVRVSQGLKRAWIRRKAKCAAEELQDGKNTFNS